MQNSPVEMECVDGKNIDKPPRLNPKQPSDGKAASVSAASGEDPQIHTSAVDHGRGRSNRLHSSDPGSGRLLRRREESRSRASTSPCTPAIRSPATSPLAKPLRVSKSAGVTAASLTTSVDSPGSSTTPSTPPRTCGEATPLPTSPPAYPRTNLPGNTTMRRRRPFVPYLPDLDTTNPLLQCLIYFPPDTTQARCSTEGNSHTSQPALQGRRLSTAAQPPTIAASDARSSRSCGASLAASPCPAVAPGRALPSAAEPAAVNTRGSAGGSIAGNGAATAAPCPAARTGQRYNTGSSEAPALLCALCTLALAVPWPAAAACLIAGPLAVIAVRMAGHRSRSSAYDVRVRASSDPSIPAHMSGMCPAPLESVVAVRPLPTRAFSMCTCLWGISSLYTQVALGW